MVDSYTKKQNKINVLSLDLVNPEVLETHHSKRLNVVKSQWVSGNTALLITHQLRRSQT